MKKRFSNIASDLTIAFPELDLRFNFVEGSGSFRVTATDFSKEALEYSIAENSVSLVNKVILDIKELGGLFDS